jgi:hypothetical protein
MFKDTVSDKTKFWWCFAILAVSGGIMFTWGALLFPPLKDLMIALNSTENAPFSVWLFSGWMVSLVGLFWLGFFILFVAAQKSLVDLILKKT